MNIQQLRYVVATAETGSMTAAAEELFVAQPALSRAIRALEGELGRTLFAKKGRGVELTGDGEWFVLRARQVLRSIATLREDDRAHGSELVIAASPTLQASLVIPQLAALRQQGATVRSRLLGCTDTAEVVRRVASGRADLGFCDRSMLRGHDPGPLETVEHLSLGSTEVMLYSPAGLDLPDRVTFADLASVPLVLPAAGSDRRAVLDEFFRVVGVVPVVAVESDDRHTWLAAVAHGIASCIWHSVELIRPRLDGVVARGFDPPMYQELLAVHRGDQASPAAELLLDVLREWSELTPANAQATSARSAGDGAVRG
ncbi:LysR family transcriptional regulator [Nocardioides limicola]|uniref:LysR family transcriptional regulator n=1 Tax=Nocardioides limicola TaxID=2803368 RepID=UPI00193B4E46|nr:LysR family transcriptional regulator [Nocardioides sp. DJM-14]